MEVLNAAKSAPAKTGRGLQDCERLGGVFDSSCTATEAAKQGLPDPQGCNPRAVREAKRELLREAIFEACGFTRLYAETAQMFAEHGDDLRHALRPQIACSGFYPDDRIAEIFLSVNQVGSPIEAIARDAAVTVSIALQFGADLETIRAALTKDHDGAPATLLGAALNALTEGRR